MRIVVLADAYRFHETDRAWLRWLERFPNSAFLHTRGKLYAEPRAVPQGQKPLGDFFREFKGAFGAIDVLFGRFSHFSTWFELDAMREALDVLQPRRFVLGYHCHLSKVLDKERHAFERADAFVFLNAAAETYFRGLYPIGDRPVHLMRSLYLPKLSWYGSFPGKKRELHFGLGGLTIRKKGRFSVAPQLAQVLPSVEQGRASVTIFGDTAEVEEGFKALRLDRSPGHAFKPGRLAEADYVNYLAANVLVGSLNGFSSPPEVDAFDRQNYPMRFNSYLKANTVPMSIDYGYEQLNALMRDEGYGWIVSDYAELGAACSGDIDVQRMVLDEPRWRAVCERNAFDAHEDALSAFLSSL